MNKLCLNKGERAPPRAFLDANLLVALALYRRGPHPLLAPAREGRYRPEWSAYVLEEAHRMLRRALPGRVAAFEALLRELPHTEVAPPPEAALAASRALLGEDSDVPVLAAARASGAEYLVTSDRRLRERAAGHAPPEVVSVPEFLRALAGREDGKTARWRDGETE